MVIFCFFKLTGTANASFSSYVDLRASLKNICRLKVFFIQFFPVAISGMFLLVYAKCNCVSLIFCVFLFTPVLIFFIFSIYKKKKEFMALSPLPPANFYM